MEKLLEDDVGNGRPESDRRRQELNQRNDMGMLFLRQLYISIETSHGTHVGSDELVQYAD